MLTDPSYSGRSPLEGSLAVVKINPDTVTMQPQPGVSFEVIKEKTRKLEIFGSLTDGIPNLRVPKVILQIDDSVEVERARGTNLIVLRGTSQGSCVEFLNISPRLKLQSLIAYLGGIAALHEQNYTFRDHKMDSIFIDSETQNVTIVDTDVMQQEGPVDKKDDLYNLQREWEGGMEKVIEAFFTRGMDRLPGYYALIPNGVRSILARKERYTSLKSLVQDLQKYASGENIFPESAVPVGKRQQKIHILANHYADSIYVQKASASTFENLSPVDFDLELCRLEQRHQLQTEYPATFDKRMLGLTQK